jgi:hypothetical protein
MKTLTLERFGPIRSVELPIADITVLVGPQATGKSLALQWLKLAIEQNRVLGTLATYGLSPAGDVNRLVGLIFGAGYQGSWDDTSRVRWEKRPLKLDALARGRARYEAEQLFYVPAHRALLLGGGWPLGFRAFSDDTPFVARQFSQWMQLLLAKRGDDPGTVFPSPHGFRAEFRERLDSALFHGGRVVIEAKGLGGKQLQLVHGGAREHDRQARLSFMEWTTGQREVLPLLVGLAHVLPSSKQTRRESIGYVVVEEPELGLHPDGTVAIMGLLLEVARRGYKLILSTHSSDVLEVLWALQHGADDGAVLDVLRLPATQWLRGTYAKGLRRLSQSLVSMDFDSATGTVSSTDISSLDPASENETISNWGGLIRYASLAAEALSK